VVLTRAAVFNLVAIRHEWRQQDLTWRQAQISNYYVFGNLKDLRKKIEQNLTHFLQNFHIISIEVHMW
jgi:hypothetical protein